MRFFARIHVITMAGISTTLFMAWWLRSYHPIIRAKKVWTRESTHVVVFGDSWSTDQLDPIYAANRSSGPVGKLWVDALCAEIVCDQIYDFAQSFPSDPSHRRGPVLDNVIYANETKQLNISAENEDLTDFTNQVDDFLALNAQWEEAGENSNQTTTIFTVLFGIWEVWDFVELEQDKIMDAIAECIASMDTQLQRLIGTRSVSSVRPTVIVPKIPDPTFFPRWVAQRTGMNGSDVYGQLQRQAVILTELWNKMLEKQFESWDKTKVNLLMPDFNLWMLEQMRLPETEDYKLSEILHVKSGPHKFAELAVPCINYTASLEPPLVTCDDPSRHLFWDDTRLSGAAHELLGKHVAQSLKNSTWY